MLKLFDPRTARDTILKRTPIDETEVPEALLKSIAQLFGEPLTPEQAVERILKDVRRRGDLALIEWTQKLDGKAPETLAVPEKTCRDALAALPAEQRAALEIAAERVRSFHQKQPITSWLNQDMGGTVGQLVRPLCRAGVYVPGGSAPLPSTVLMSAIPAQVAGVSRNRHHRSADARDRPNCAHHPGGRCFVGDSRSLRGRRITSHCRPGLWHRDHPSGG